MVDDQLAQKINGYIKNEGIKHDKDKVDLTYFSQSILEGPARVFEFGAKKYSRNNWKQLENGYERFLQASQRHLASIYDGEWFDNVGDGHSDLPHIDHAIVSLLMARWHYYNKP